MTKRTLNAHELEIIAGGAVDIAEDDPTTDKSQTGLPPASDDSSSTGGGSVDNEQVQQNQDLPGA